MNQFSITIDTDWVPDEVLSFTINLLNSYDITGTFFCTNPTNCNFGKHEVAIHPNFTSLDFEKHIDEMLTFFQNSKGMRSHSLFFTERLRPILAGKGIEYCSNYMLFEHVNLAPCMISPTVLELPIYFMDTFNLIMKGDNALFANDLERLNLEGLKVYDFHPIHIYMNTYSVDHYDTFKFAYKDVSVLKEYINTKHYGIRNYLEDLLTYIHENGKQHDTLINLSNQYRIVNNEGNINR